MKRTLILPLCLIFCLIFGACKAPAVSHAPELIEYFECNLEAETPLSTYKCHFIRDEGKSEITVTEPESIAGLILTYENGVYTAEFNSVKLSLDDRKTQRTKYFADGVIKLIEETFSLENMNFREENGLSVYEGDSSYGKFKITFDSEGGITNIEIPSIDTVVKVTDFKAAD